MALVSLAGCQLQSEGIVVEENLGETIEADQFSIELSGQEYIYHDNQNIYVEHPGQGVILTISAKDPSNIIWSEDRKSIIWTELETMVSEVEQQCQYYIYEYSLHTGEQKIIYWSKAGEMSGLSLSWQSHFLGFIENQALYALDIKSGKIIRLSEDAQFWKWSPGELAMIISDQDSTRYITLDPDLSVATETELLEEKKVQGLDFLNKKTVLSFVFDEEAQFIIIDLRNLDNTKELEWHHNYSNDPENIRYIIHSSNTEKYFSIQETEQEKLFSTILLYNYSIMSTKGSLKKATVIGWRNNDIIMIARKDSKKISYSMIEFDLQSGQETIVAEDLPSLPVIISK